MKRHNLLVDGEPVTLQLGQDCCVWGERRVRVDLEPLDGGTYSVILDGIQHAVQVRRSGEGAFDAFVGGHSLAVEIRNPRKLARGRTDAGASGAQEVCAPMPGKVLAVRTADGAEVRRGQGLVVIEAMKMQNELRAPRDGRVAAVRVAEGDSVAAGATLLAIE